MKLIGALLGIAIAWALNKYAPAAVLHVLSIPNLLTPVGAAAAALTVPWPIALGRLSVFEKLDDLPGGQIAVVSRRARSTRNFIVRSMITNAVLLVLMIGLLTVAPSAALTFFALCVSVAVWLAGLFQAWRCWLATEESRLTIAEAQAIERGRKKYLDAIRADDRKTPVDRNDPHLNGYHRVAGS